MSMSWPDELRARMFARRTVSLFGHLDDELATRAAAELWTLDAEGDGPISLLVSLRGGTARASLALIDALDIVGVEVHATCLGACNGSAIAPFAAASTRLAAPHARFSFEQDWRSFSGSATALDAEARRADEEFRQVVARLAEATAGRRSVGDVLLDYERRRSIDAVEAIGYGIVDALLPDRPRSGGLADPPPFGFTPR